MRTFARIALTLATVGAATPAAAQNPGQPGPSTSNDSTRRLGAVMITATASGMGEARALTTLGRVELRETASGTSALKVIERLPGINFQSADPWGTYEWSTRVSVRGFLTSQIGQTFDGLPLGDMSYGNFNGLGIGRAVDAENLAGAGVAQGSGALGTSSANNLGGVIQYASDVPRARGGLSLKQTVGLANTYRTSLRWDTGLWSSGDKAFSAFVSASRHDNDKWKGGFTAASPVNNGILGRSGLLHDGQTWQEQVNTKLVAAMGSQKLTAFYSFSNRSEADYTDLSLARYNSSGRGWDQYADWNAAKAAAVSSTPDEAYWQSALGARRDNLAYLLGELSLGGNVRLALQPYLHSNIGNGDWTAPSYGATWSPDPIYFRQTQYDGDRAGANARLTLEATNQRFESGLWLENNTTNIRRAGWRLANYDAGPVVDFNNMIRLFFDRTGKINTTVFYAQNTSRLIDGQLRLTYGAKYLNVKADYTNNGNTANATTFGDPTRPAYSISAKGEFLPQLGAVWSMSPENEVFANYSENVNQFPFSPQSGVYNQSATVFEPFKQNVKPERASTIDVGFRTRRDDIEASLATYYVNYRNRLVSIANCQLTATCASVFSNVGAIRSYGVEALLLAQLNSRFSWSSSASWNSSKIQDDYKSGTAVIATKGKSVVDSPRMMWSTTLRYNNAGWNGNLGGRFVGERYFSILNDVSVPSYLLFDGGLGYTFGSFGVAKELGVQLNVTNIFDAGYIATVGTGGFSNSGDLQTLMAGARRLAFLTLRTSF
jgi:iron complex outermembrane receptor protein